RDRRSERSRGRERDYRGSDRGRDRGDRMDRGMDRGLDRGLEHRGTDRGVDQRREEIPNNTIMVRGMPIETTEPELRNEVTRYGLEPKDIRLMKRKDTGASRGFAFVEFRYLSEAVRWKELTKGVVSMGETRCSLHYSIPKDGGPVGMDRASLMARTDWNCGKCGVNNFRRRDNCFKCSAAREEAEIPNSGDGFDEISSVPTNTLLLRNLDVLTTEERVLAVLGQTTNVPIKSLKVARDPKTGTSRGFCYVELHTVAEAAQLDDLLMNLAGQFYVDGRQGKTGPHDPLPGCRFSCSGNTSSVASVALAAAQWTNQPSTDDEWRVSQGAVAAAAPVTYGPHPPDAATAAQMAQEPVMRETPVHTPKASATVSSLGTVMVDGVNYPRYPVPDVSTYRYDDKSGYYYDASTGLYYDANSHYYYNAEAQQYMYWNNDKQTYLPAPTSSSTAEQVAQAAANTGGDGTDAEKGKGAKKEGKEDKVKIAKKIAKRATNFSKWLSQLGRSSQFCIDSVILEWRPGLVGSLPRSKCRNYTGTRGRRRKQGALATSNTRRNEAGQQEVTVLRDVTLPKQIKDCWDKGPKYSQEPSMSPVSKLSVPGWTGDKAKPEDRETCVWPTAWICSLRTWKEVFWMPDALCKTRAREAVQKNLKQARPDPLTKLKSHAMQRCSAVELTGLQKSGNYRDRARERRIKYGQPEPPQAVHKEKPARPTPAQQNYEEPTKAGIGEDNIGNKMLKAMGWSEGQGLGKSNTGTTNIVEVRARGKA
ncbi:unnamed protein product, partial [Ixodes hexagonus]